MKFCVKRTQLAIKIQQQFENAGADADEKEGGAAELFDEAQIDLQVSFLPAQTKDLKKAATDLLLTLLMKYWDETEAYILSFADVKLEVKTGMMHTVFPY